MMTIIATGRFAISRARLWRSFYGQAVLQLGLMVAVGTVCANNAVVTNTILRTPVAGKVQVKFDLSWENSWRDGVNYDACWVFVKYSTNSGTN